MHILQIILIINNLDRVYRNEAKLVIFQALTLKRQNLNFFMNIKNNILNNIRFKNLNRFF